MEIKIIFTDEESKRMLDCMIGNANIYGHSDVKVFPVLVSNTKTIKNLPQGSVIDLGDGNPWVVVHHTAETGEKEGYSYIMAMHNYGDRKWKKGDTLADIFDTLPTTIGGLNKNEAIIEHEWDWEEVDWHGNVRSFKKIASRLSFVSAREWQGRDNDLDFEPEEGSVGAIFCQAWKGTACKGSDLYSAFYYPWARSGYSSISSDAWYLLGDSDGSLDVSLVGSDGGSLPVAWIKNDLVIGEGGGIFDEPYKLVGKKD